MSGIETGGRSGSLPGAAIARVAKGQWGQVSRAQLLAEGLSEAAIARAVARGWLRRVHLGVYAVSGSPRSNEARWMAAVLAGGDGARLSARSACELWTLVPAIEGPVHVMVAHSGRRRPGIVFHRRGESCEPVSRLGIPVTPVERSLVDYAASAAPWEIRRAFEAGDRRGLIDPVRLMALCGRGRPGTGRLAKLARTVVSDPQTRSPLERDFLRFCRSRGLPLPLINQVVRGFEVDCFWPDPGLVVELDGYGFHRSPQQFERDRARDAVLQLAGLVVLRVTPQRLNRDPDSLEHQLRTALGLPSRPFRKGSGPTPERDSAENARATRVKSW